MNRTDNPTILDALEDLLERERALILAGDFDGLARQASEKTASLAGLAAQSGNPATFERLRRAALRNQSLIGAATRGLRAAQARLAALHDPQAALRTYGRDGVPTNLGSPAHGINRRA
jgi:hypothetical protein